MKIETRYNVGDNISLIGSKMRWRVRAIHISVGGPKISGICDLEDRNGKRIIVREQKIYGTII